MFMAWCSQVELYNRANTGPILDDIGLILDANIALTLACNANLEWANILCNVHNILQTILLQYCCEYCPNIGNQYPFNIGVQYWPNIKILFNLVSELNIHITYWANIIYIYWLNIGSQYWLNISNQYWHNIGIKY